jgi:hypothetical protein
MRKQSKKMNKASWGAIFVVVLVLGVGLGYGVFYAQKKIASNQPIQVPTVQSERLADGSDLPADVAEGLSVDTRSNEERKNETYQGSEAELEVVREISDEEVKKLEDAVGGDGYVNRAYGFAFNPPEGWYADGINSEIGQFISFSNFDPEGITSRPEDAGLILEAVVQGNTKNQSLDEWIEEGHGYMKVISSEKIQLGEHDAYKEELDYQGEMSVVTVVRGEDVFTLSLMGEGYQENKDLFDEVVDSLIIL